MGNKGSSVVEMSLIMPIISELHPELSADEVLRLIE